jgi:hypothetical protein
VIWRAVLLAVYVGLGIVFGGAVVILFFVVWGGVWLGFSLWWGWADRVRTTLLKRSTSG